MPSGRVPLMVQGYIGYKGPVTNLEYKKIYSYFSDDKHVFEVIPQTPTSRRHSEGWREQRVYQKILKM